jgi:MFS family permease
MSRLAVATEALQSKNYRRFFIGAFLSNCGTWMQEAAVPYVLFQLRHDPALIGIGAFLGIIPYSLVAPIGGSIADRFNRRRVLLITQSLSIIGPLILAIAWWSGSRSIPLIFLILTIDAAISGIAVPSWVSYMTDCVPREAIGNAVTLNSAQLNAARGVGPVLAGLILSLFGPGYAFLFNALSFLAVVIAVALTHPLREVKPTQSKPLQSLIEGYRYVAKSSTLLLCITFGFLLGSCGMTVFWLMPTFIAHVFHASSLAYGLLAGAAGLGTVVGVLVVSVVAQKRKRSAIIRLFMPIFAGVLFLFAHLNVLFVAWCVMFVSGVTYMCVISVVLSSVQYASTDALRGRVTSAYIMTVTLALPLGTLVEGFVAKNHGAPVALDYAAGILMAAGILVNVVPSLAARFDWEAVPETKFDEELAPIEVVGVEAN